MTSTDQGSRVGVAVVIPALNEELTLPGILAELPGWIDHVVVADNGSHDRTADVARLGGATVVRETRRGYGSACLAGIEYLRRLPTPPRVVVFMDADGSDVPTEIDRLVDPILDDDIDFVLGVRRGEGGDVGTILPHARLGNFVVLLTTRLLFGEPFRDLPPFRAISFEALEALEMDDRDWGWTLQMQIRAAIAGLSVREVDVTHRRRAQGESKISGSLAMSVRVGAKMFYTLGRERVRGWRS